MVAGSNPASTTSRETSVDLALLDTVDHLDRGETTALVVAKLVRLSRSVLDFAAGTVGSAGARTNEAVQALKARGIRLAMRWLSRWLGRRGQARHTAGPDPRGTRIGSGHLGGVREKRTGGASMWTSPSGLGAS